MSGAEHMQHQRGAQCPSRGLALFVGLFSLANMVGAAIGNGANQNIWWVDFSILALLPGGVGDACGMALQVLGGVLLAWWALFPDAGRARGAATALVALLLAVVALQNAGAYWMLLASGGLRSALPIPLSLLIGAAFLVLAWKVARRPLDEHAHGALRGVGVALWAVAFALVFPLLQICFFGTTDYRQGSGAVVVLGAQVHEDGTPSLALAERMDTAVELYDEHLAPYLIVSGGTGAEGVSEAQTMAAYAQERGVPEERIIVDEAGVNSDAAVENSLALAREHDIGTLMVTSSFYHMPRLKMSYLARGADALTVPTTGDMRNNGTATALWREVPAWWLYWFRATLGV